MKLIIFGSTGGTGRKLVEQALERGYEVTAFVRNPKKLSQKHGRLTIVQGDVLDPESVEKAIKGHDAVICALGQPPKDKTNLRTNGTKNIVHAMEKASVKRLICQSTAGAGDSRNTLPFMMRYLIVPLFLRRVWADHEMQEEIVKESHLDWTVARPAALTDDDFTGVYQEDYSADNRTVTSKISRADTADFMLKQLADDSYLHKTPCLSY